MARGGFRPGAGRKPGGGKARASIPAAVASGGAPKGAALANLSPLDYLLAVMNDPDADEARRDRCAQVAAPLMHARAGEAGKKDQREMAAAAAARGRFSPAPAPALSIVKG